MSRPTLIARFSTTAHENARQPDTPLASAWSFVVRHKGELRECITVRTYFSPRGSGMQPVRACVWIRAADGSEWRSGRGSAGGCGYHKESRAIVDAIEPAGVNLFGEIPHRNDGTPIDRKKRFHFGGTGDSYYRAVFEAIARAAGYRIRPGSSILVYH